MNLSIRVRRQQTVSTGPHADHLLPSVPHCLVTVASPVPVTHTQLVTLLLPAGPGNQSSPAKITEFHSPYRYHCPWSSQKPAIAHRLMNFLLLLCHPGSPAAVLTSALPPSARSYLCSPPGTGDGYLFASHEANDPVPKLPPPSLPSQTTCGAGSSESRHLNSN